MLARLAVPNVAAVAATTAVTFADVYFIGQIGTTALASLAIDASPYLVIAAPVYGIFGGGQTLYFASQGTGHMILPVIITYTRFLVVASFGLAGTIFDWSLTTIFAGVGFGLSIVGIGQMLNLLRGPAWNHD